MENTNWVGVDTHKNTLACYSRNDFREFSTTDSGYKKALEWAGENAVFAIEGAYCFGRPFANYLINKKRKVYEINPFITKSWRSALSANGNKNDYGDAKVISIFSKNLKLQEISLKTIKLKENLTAREQLVKQRTSLINAIKMLISTRGIEAPCRDFTTQKAVNYFKNQDDIILQNYAKLIEEINKSINIFEKEIYKLVPEQVFELTNICGIEKLTAAIIYAETKGKLTTKAAFANYCALAPIEDSSGKTRKHSTNHRGNRTLNSIFFRIALSQMRYDERGKAYYDRKLSEGKTKRQARKCLARQLTNVVFRVLNQVQ